MICHACRRPLPKRTTTNETIDETTNETIDGTTNETIDETIDAGGSDRKCGDNDMDGKHVVVFCDGSERLGKSGIGVVWYHSAATRDSGCKSDYFHAISEEIVNAKTENGISASNNRAEYMALIRAMQVSIEHGAKSVQVFMDSNLVVKQMNGEYRVNDSRLQTYNKTAKEVATRLESVVITHVKRNLNAMADKMSKAYFQMSNKYSK